MSRHDSADRPDDGLTRRRFLAAALGTVAVAASGVRFATAQTAASSIYRGPTNVNRVALTFDCGADLGYTSNILDTLATNGIRSSFGMTGQFAEAYPSMVRRMVGPTLANGYSWYQLTTSYGLGWAAGEFLEKTSETPPPSTGGYPAGTRVRTTGSSLRLRASASTGAAIIATMPLGTVCIVVGGPQLSGGYTWYQLDTPYGRGCAAGEFLARV